MGSLNTLNNAKAAKEAKRLRELYEATPEGQKSKAALDASRKPFLARFLPVFLLLTVFFLAFTIWVSAPLAFTFTGVVLISLFCLIGTAANRN